MKKKVLFTTFNLEIGGIETSLVNLVNSFDFDKYDVTILLQQKNGPLIDRVDSRVKVESYELSTIKFTLFRKFINLIKLVVVFFKYSNKYDFAACYGTGYRMSAKVALHASKNNAIWMHTNIVQFVSNQHVLNENLNITKEVDSFLREAHFREFKKYFFVSKNGMNAYLELYPEDTEKAILCNNVIDYQRIISLSEENPEDLFKKNEINLINVSRHTEYDKRLSRLLYAVQKLSVKYSFKLYMIGDGEQHNYYIDLAKKLKIDKIVIFLGRKENPYPYIKNADAFLMSSAFEGFPTTIMESLILNIPIITTNVSDVESLISGKYGIVVKNDDEDIISGIKYFLDNKFIIAEKFDPETFNTTMLSRIYNVIDGEEDEI